MGDLVMARQAPTATALPNASEVVCATVKFGPGVNKIYLRLKNTHATNPLYWRIERVEGTVTEPEEPVADGSANYTYNTLPAVSASVKFQEVTSWVVTNVRATSIRVIAKGGAGAASELTLAYEAVASQS